MDVEPTVKPTNIWEHLSALRAMQVAVRAMVVITKQHQMERSDVPSVFLPGLTHPHLFLRDFHQDLLLTHYVPQDR